MASFSMHRHRGTSLIPSRADLCKSDIIGEVIITTGGYTPLILCTVKYKLRLSEADRNGEVAFTSEVTVR